MVQIPSSQILASLLSENREDDALDLHRVLGASDAGTHARLIDILSARGDDRAALELAAAAQRRYPLHSGLAMRHVSALMRESDPGQAARAAAGFADRSGNHGLWAMQAEAFFRAGDHRKAGDILDLNMPRSPGNTGAWLITARLLWEHRPPELAGALTGLNERLSALRDEVSISHGLLHLARGLILEAEEQFDEAWASILRGNQILDQTVQSEPEEEAQLTERIIETIDADWIADHSLDRDTAEPLFIVGTSLSGIEVAYACACDTRGYAPAGQPRMFERDILRLCGDPIDARHGAHLATLETRELLSLRTRYLATIRHRIGGQSAFVDGLAGNIRYAGVLKAMFPTARFIHPLAPRSETLIHTLRAPLDPQAHRLTTSHAKVSAMLEAREALATHWAAELGPAWVSPAAETPRAGLQAHGLRPEDSQGQGALPGLLWPAPRKAALIAYQKKLKG